MMYLYSLCSAPYEMGSSIVGGYSVISKNTSPTYLKIGLTLNLPDIASAIDGYFISSSKNLILVFLVILT